MRVLFDVFEKALKGRFMALSGLDLLGGGSSLVLTIKLKFFIKLSLPLVKNNAN